MTNCSRRDFFLGHWAKENERSQGRDEPREAERPTSDALTELPSDFSPALLRMQARTMGLNVETMTDKEIALAVLRAMNEQTPR